MAAVIQFTASVVIETVFAWFMHLCHFNLYTCSWSLWAWECAYVLKNRV